ncbi:MAG: DUF2147 domain-containing protein [Treponema sp.]|jgi:uncharacterized protein (DUF2147 family)|nr:DUF2147 domain-containing protein [Treponema sp.]
MKKITTLCVGLFLSVRLFAADPVEGYWVSVDDKTGKVTAGWEMYQTEGKLYGKMLSVADFPQHAKAVYCKDSYQGFPVAGKVNELPVVGTPWIFGLMMEKPGQWSGGNIVDPQSGNMYKCKITFRPVDGKRFKSNTLEMRGEIGLGIGRSQFWRKSTREEAAGLR